MTHQPCQTGLRTRSVSTVLHIEDSLIFQMTPRPALERAALFQHKAGPLAICPFERLLDLLNACRL
jgi:hypothetical protein